MTLSPGLRKLALTIHVTSSLGWVGAAGAFFALAVTGLDSADAQLVRGAYLAMDVIARYAILPSHSPRWRRASSKGSERSGGSSATTGS